ncbi:MAG TPA: vitamin K epoxide reductase family protein [Frankiaceae bacterium]|nr:vitamin K epoxide reductase family protein [Frankiaceae bacterium]
MTGDADLAVRWKAPRWAAPVSLLVCVLGIAVASYLTYAHYTDVRNLACSDRGVVNCAKVTTSSQSHFLGMPVAVLGLAFFVAMAALCLPWSWRRPEPIVRYARLGAALGGVAMILWLVYAELFIIDAICLYCTVVHGLTLIFFLVVASATVSGTSRPVLDEFEDYDEYDDDDEENDEPATAGDGARVGSSD